MTSLASLVRAPIDPIAIIRAVSNPGNGAVLLFLGAVRQGNEAMAQRELETIVTDASSKFDGADVAVQHRLGELAVEDVSVAIAVGHAHRDAAYAASRFVIEELKRRVPIWKREHYTDGTREWVDPTGRARAGAPA